MGKKTITQVILIIFLIVLTYFVFKKYYIKNDTVAESNNKDQTISKNESQKSDKNIIKDISYTANNSRGDIYLLLADYGEVYLDNPELMFLTKVNGKITLQDGMNVTIKSDFANFNTKNFETTFINNVIVERREEKITGDELYLVLERTEKEIQDLIKKDENLVRMSRNVVYKKPGYNLSADILEIDLITKNIKIYMMNEYRKVIATREIK
jgi:lipopolysaccharide export system protein LptA